MLLSLPPETIERVILFATTQESVGGPPPNLCALMSTCRRLHAFLSPVHNPWFCARLFCSCFDLSAPQRRFPAEPFGPAELAAEAQRRFAALRLIRAKHVRHPDVLQTLYAAYVMLLEDDVRNGVQLRWAGLGAFLDALDAVEGENEEVRCLALVLKGGWLREETLGAEGQDERLAMLTKLDPHLLGRLSVDAENTGWSETSPQQLLDSGAPQVPRPPRLLPYFGHSLAITAPLPALHAILSYVLRIELYQLAKPWGIPATSAERAEFGPTMEDFEEYNAACAARSALCKPHTRASSAQHDADWARLLSREPQPWPGSYIRPYRLGLLCGSWGGTLLLPPLDHACEGPADGTCGLGPAEYVSRQPVLLELREHYRYNTPLSSTIRCEDALDDAANLPPACRRAVGLPRPAPCRDRAAGHVPSSCGCTRALANFALDESEVAEVILTGVTPDKFGMAWGSYRYRGRVRLSDGLVCLNREPIGSGATASASFCGYILGAGRLVGRWRVGNAREQTPWEGIFGLCKSS